MQVLLSMLAILASIFISIMIAHSFNRHTYVASREDRLEDKINSADERIQKLESDLDSLMSNYESIDNIWRSRVATATDNFTQGLDEDQLEDLNLNDDNDVLDAEPERILDVIIRNTELDDNGYKDIRNSFMNYIYENESDIKNRIIESDNTNKESTEDSELDKMEVNEMKEVDTLVSEYREDKKLASRKRRELENLKDRRSDLIDKKNSTPYSNLRYHVKFSLLAAFLSVIVPAFTAYLYSVGFSLGVDELELVTDNDVLAVLVLWVLGLIVSLYPLAKLIRR